MESPITFERLWSGARHFAHLALNAHAQKETEVFLLEAGVSIERLAKAVLVHANPALLVELSSRQDGALLHLAGVAEMPEKLRTIGARGAIGRLRMMKVLPDSSKLDTLIELRNGVAHLGTSDPEDYLAPFVETICMLLDHAKQDRDAFWGPWSNAVRVALDDRADHLQKAVHLRIEQASLRAKTHFADMPEGTGENLAKLVAQRGLIVVEVGPTGALFQALTRCPACHTEAAALFLKAPNTALLFDLELAAEGLWCDICHLHLGSGKEVGIAGLPVTARYSAEDLIQVSDHSPTPQSTDPTAAELLAHAMQKIPGDSL
ncbi:hypothetical protein [Streptomyces iranensis]|uniref:hypothetical protein n=1 Tax=Streptomyces iranensis TaxID=576784 RepID=UPI0039B794B8